MARDTSGQAFSMKKAIQNMLAQLKDAEVRKRVREHIRSTKPELLTDEHAGKK